MSTGLPPSAPPSENTLTINISHEQLSVLENIGLTEAIAVSPTRLMEKDYAYDVAIDWDWAKIFYQQFKRPSAETGTIQGRKGTDGHIKFDINPEQVRKLQNNYREGVAFLTFPLVQSRDEMPDNLDQTVFVDVHGLTMNDATIAYIHENWRQVSKDDIVTFSIGNGLLTQVLPKDTEFARKFCFQPHSCVPGVHINAEDSIETVDPRYVMTWEQVLSNLLTCNSGSLLREDGITRQEEGVWSRSAIAIIFGGNKLPRDINW